MKHLRSQRRHRKTAWAATGLLAAVLGGCSLPLWNATREEGAPRARASAWPEDLTSSNAGNALYHQVAAGESLADVAATYDVPVGQLQRANGLHSDEPLKPGQLLLIPGSRDRSATRSESADGDH